ncbi:MAG: dihydroneopterin triphosphate diphosphatase [Enterobacteriaceae bacterium]
MTLSTSYKCPESVLVVIYATNTERVLLLQRNDDPDFWQSVTGSLEQDELPYQAAIREVREETGIDIAGEQLLLQDCHRGVVFEIFPAFRHRYAPGVTHNVEHWFSLPLSAERQIYLTEHLNYRWVSVAEAITLSKSWSNRQAIAESI